MNQDPTPSAGWSPGASLFLILALASCGPGEDRRDGGPRGDASADAAEGPDAAGGSAVDSIFQVYACMQSDPGFCPTGAFAGFDREAFRDVYADPFGAGPDHGLYPSGDASLPYVGFAVPQCEDSTLSPPVDAGSDVDPATWTCPDGTPTIQCGDGTRPVAYYQRARDASSTRWLIAISNGGADCSGDSCVAVPLGNLHRFSGAFGGRDAATSSFVRTRSRTGSAGLFGRPAFANFHRVIIDQCAGGRGVGVNDAVATVTDPLSGEVIDVPIHHHGSRILRATLDQLLRSASASPTQIVFASHSNGSNGAYVEIDDWARWINAHPAVTGVVDVRLLANSMVHSSIDVERCANDPGCASVLDAYDHAGGGWNELSETIRAPGSTDLAAACPTGAREPGRCGSEGEGSADVPADGLTCSTAPYQPGGFVGDRSAELGIASDTSCVAAHAGELSACLDPLHVLLYHVETPTYLALSGYDRAMRSGAVNRCTIEVEAFSLDDMHARMVAFARAMPESRPGQRDAVRLPGHGAWVDSSTDHEGPTNGNKLDRELRVDDGSTITLQDSFRAWLDASDARAPLCISDGEARDDPANPMNSARLGGTPVAAAACF